MKKSLGIYFAIYFIWISIYRNFAKDIPQWDSLYFIIEDAFFVLLFFELKKNIFSNKIINGFLWAGIVFKSYMVLYDIICYTPYYEKYIEARKDYLWNSIGILLIMIIILITLINRKR